MGDGRKKPKYKNECENQGKILRLVAPSSPRLRNGVWLLSGVRKLRKQAGPTLIGRGFLVYWVCVWTTPFDALLTCIYGGGWVHYVGSTIQMILHKLESILENETHKILWNFEIQTDHLISARRPDLVLVNNKKKNPLSSGLSRAGGPQNENQRKWKGRQVLRPYQITKKVMEHDDDDDDNTYN